MEKNAYEILTEKDENGNAMGRDPRTIPAEDFAASGLFDRPLTQVIREKCLDCCGGSSDEVKKCTAVSCSLWAYRTKKNPFRKKTLTDEQRKAMSDRLVAAREKAKQS